MFQLSVLVQPSKISQPGLKLSLDYPEDRKFAEEFNSGFHCCGTKDNRFAT